MVGGENDGSVGFIHGHLSVFPVRNWIGMTGVGPRQCCDANGTISQVSTTQTLDDFMGFV